LTNSENTEPEVFIIESLNFDDEKNNRYEGKIISDILHLNGKNSKYYYIRTKRELEEVIEIFLESNYRYLHLSCHGNSREMATTLDLIDFEELGDIIGPCLLRRRLFVSSCKMTNSKLAKAIIPDSDCFSIIRPAKDVSFNDAAILWASLYHLMFKHNFDVMKREDLLKYCRKLAKLFRVPLNYFGRNRNEEKGFTTKRIRP
jgi:hypothetical protein